MAAAFSGEMARGSGEGGEVAPVVGEGGERHGRGRRGAVGAVAATAAVVDGESGGFGRRSSADLAGGGEMREGRRREQRGRERVGVLAF